MERTRPAASVGLLFSLADADELGRGGYLGFFDGDKPTFVRPPFAKSLVPTFPTSTPTSAAIFFSPPLFTSPYTNSFAIFSFFARSISRIVASKTA